MNNTLAHLKDIKGVCVLEEGDLSKYTGFRTGGKSAVVIPNNKVSFIETINYLRKSETKFFILGNGTNVIARDEGYDGVVVLTKNALNYINVDGFCITVGAGTPISEVCNAALNSELTGLEFAYGIPGSVGGAVYMNAGAYDGEIKDIIHSVEYLDENGQIKFICSPDIQFSYRNSVFHTNKDWIVLSAVMRLEHGDVSEIKAKMLDLIGRRRDKQPLEYPSCGSTFKRPLGNYASKLIDECGFRGFRVGGAQVSEKHCGFVINRDNATSKDIFDLIEIIRDTVQEKTGYLLECEVEILE